MVHVGDAVGIDAGQERDGIGKIGHILPGDLQAGGRGDGDEVERVIGRTAGGVQADEAVDDGLLVDDVADRRVVIALGGERQSAASGFAGQRIAQRRAWIDEAGARQVQAHDFHQHLVGIGGAVERAGAGRMVGLGLGFQQFGAADLAFHIELADAALFIVGQARRHRAGGHEDGRQMAEGQCADEQAGHDLVADAEIDGGIEHVVAERNGRRHGDDIAREQAQVHALLALGHAIAHGGHATGDLGGGAHFARRGFDDVGIELIGLMGRQHVVIGGDDAEVERRRAGKLRLFGRRAGGEAVGEVAAGETGAVDALPRAASRRLRYSLREPALRAAMRSVTSWIALRTAIISSLVVRASKRFWLTPVDRKGKAATGKTLWSPVNSHRLVGLAQHRADRHVINLAIGRQAMSSTTDFSRPRCAYRANASARGAAVSV
jgi:hypothetical protein